MSDDIMRVRLGLTADRSLGDFDALLRMLDEPSDPRTMTSGYATLMNRVASTEFQRRAGRT